MCKINCVCIKNIYLKGKWSLVSMKESYSAQILSEFGLNTDLNKVIFKEHSIVFANKPEKEG